MLKKHSLRAKLPLKTTGSSDIHETYRASRKEYRQKLRIFLNQCEADKIAKLCNAAGSNEKLFWKLIKSQRSSSQMNTFLVNGERTVN